MSDIRKAIQRLAEKNEELYLKLAIVDAVDAVKRTCDVSPLDGSAPILGVNLQANQSGKTGLLILPVTGSYVAVAFLDRNTGCVVLTDQIESVEVKIGGCTVDIDQSGCGIELDGQKVSISNSGLSVEMTSGKLMIKNSLYSLKDALTDLTKALSAMTVVTQAGPVPPVNVADFASIEVKINTLLL
ncbi:MAG: hypothetical protein RSA53_05535 [Odoribacter sp.]